MKKPLQKKQDLSWFFILLLFLGVLVLFFSQNEDSGSQELSKKHLKHQDSPEQLRRVNKYLKDTAMSLEKDRLHRTLEVNRELQKYSNSSGQEGYQVDTRLSFEGDPNMQALTRELDGSQSLEDRNLTPEQIIQRRLYENELLQKADQAYREQYAAEFIENARRSGWAIELGPNFEVLSVRKIPNANRRPTQLFEPGASGSR